MSMFSVVTMYLVCTCF